MHSYMKQLHQIAYTNYSIAQGIGSFPFTFITATHWVFCHSTHHFHSNLSICSKCIGSGAPMQFMLIHTLVLTKTYKWLDSPLSDKSQWQWCLGWLDQSLPRQDLWSVCRQCALVFEKGRGLQPNFEELEKKNAQHEQHNLFMVGSIFSSSWPWWFAGIFWTCHLKLRCQLFFLTAM